MNKKTGSHTGKSVKIAAIAIVAIVVIAGICFVALRLGLFGSLGSKESRILSSAMKEWTSEWANGNESSLESGLVFGVTESGGAKQETADDMALSQDEFKAVMEEQYGELVETEETDKEQKRLFQIIMQHTTVTYKLPSDIEDGQVVTFEISGPDMMAIVGLLDKNAEQEELFNQLDGILAGDGWPGRKVTAQAKIEALDNGYRLENSFELIDGLYGGLLSLVGNALPEIIAK